MAVFWANGVSATSHNQSWYSDPDWYETRVTTPNIQPAWDGRQLGLIVQLRPSVAGLSGTVQTRAWVSNTDGSDWKATPLFNVGKGYASFQGWQTLTSPKAFVGGAEF